jgi:hypothetical protein
MRPGTLASDERPGLIHVRGRRSASALVEDDITRLTEFRWFSMQSLVPSKKERGDIADRVRLRRERRRDGG